MLSTIMAAELKTLEIYKMTKLDPSVLFVANEVISLLTLPGKRGQHLHAQLTALRDVGCSHTKIKAYI